MDRQWTLVNVSRRLPLLACMHLLCIALHHTSSFIRPSAYRLICVGLKESAQFFRQQTPKQWKHSAATATKQGSTTDKREYLTRHAPSKHAPPARLSPGVTQPEIRNSSNLAPFTCSLVVGNPNHWSQPAIIIEKEKIRGPKTHDVRDKKLTMDLVSPPHARRI